jgi:hypothetical protein
LSLAITCNNYLVEFLFPEIDEIPIAASGENLLFEHVDICT